MTHSGGTFATIDGALMADDDPEAGTPQYTRYRAVRRPPWRRRREPFDPFEGLEELRARPDDRIGAPPGRRWWRPRRGSSGRRPRWRRVLRWALAAFAAWIGVSVLLFIVSSLSAAGVPSSALAQLDGGGLPIVSPATILVLGSDARTASSKEPGANPNGPSRSDVMLLIRTGGGHSARLSIPRDTIVSIPGHGVAKINAAYAYGGPALAIETVKQFLHVKVNHVILINFTNFPKLVDAMGGVTFSGGCVVSYINGGFRNGGYTLRLRAGTHHLNGAQALALARTRENACNRSENDLTRERRQQKLFLEMKSQMLSLTGLIRLPFIAWAVPQTIETDMGAPSLAMTMLSLELSGNAHSALLTPTGAARLPDGEQGLTITDAARQAAVAAFLRS